MQALVSGRSCGWRGASKCSIIGIPGLAPGLAQVSTEEIREMEARWSSMGIDSKMPVVDEDITEVQGHPLTAI